MNEYIRAKTARILVSPVTATELRGAVSATRVDACADGSCGRWEMLREKVVLATESARSMRLYGLI